MVVVYSITGEKIKDIELPSVFKEEIRPDIINRACLAYRSRFYQPKGTYSRAGLETSARYVGRRYSYHSMIARGIARLPRILLPKGGIGQVRKVPQARKGRRAHPPKVEKILEEKINKKEYKKALRSAIAATAVSELVKRRNHIFEGEVPIIIEDKFSELKKTKEVMEVLKKLGLEKELERTKEKKIRAGKGKMRGKKYKKKKGILIVVDKDSPIKKAARNIPGIDICEIKELNPEVLAPGGVPGRLTIYTESAIKALEEALC